MAGMAIAVVATLLHPNIHAASYARIVVAIADRRRRSGVYIARRIQMTALPQLVAAFHSLVGMAAVFVAAAALNAPEAFGIGHPGAIHVQSRIEMSLGLAIGAITFSGSVIAFAKLQGIMRGAPIIFPQQHRLNALLGAIAVAADRSLRCDWLASRSSG